MSGETGGSEVGGDRGSDILRFQKLVEDGLQMNIVCLHPWFPRPGWDETRSSTI